MDYKSADEQLQGRCHDSRKIGNNTYLQRRGSDIAVQLHATDVITFHKNGSITLDTGGWNTVTTKDRINSFQPYRVGSERGQLFVYTRAWEKRYVFHRSITIRKDGKVTGVSEAARVKQLESVYETWRKEDREAARVSRWLAKARGLKRTHRCDKDWCRCHPRAGWGRRQTLQLGKCEDCGCVVERVQHKTKLTVQEIMQEGNISVRMAMAHVYGLERFLIDAQAKTIDTLGEYALLDMPMGQWQTIRALKMTCPSTGAVYISPVDPHVQNVSEALDWYFQTKDYLTQVTQAS